MSFDAAFVDRDGTLIEDPGYLSDPAGVRILPGAAEFVARLNRLGVPVYVATNQSGIGRGYYGHEEFRAVQAETERRLRAAGARLDGVYVCPHDPDSEACDCRKPAAGLFRQAAREHGLRLHRCLYVGDRPRDVEAGLRAGGIGVLVAAEGATYDDPAADGCIVAPDLETGVERALERERTMSQPTRVVVFVSGSGTNLQALLDRFTERDGGVAVARVIGSRPGIGALERATASGVPWSVLPAVAADALDEAYFTELEEARADLVVLAGYLKLVPEAVVRAWRGRMLNIHPALLPSFGGPGMYGRRVHEAVLASGARISGPTVHFVDEVYDHGAIAAQWPVPVMEGDDPERLAARVLKAEHRLLPEVVAAVAAGECRLDDDGRCSWTRPLFAGANFQLAGED